MAEEDVAAKDELDPFVCEGCGAAMMPEDMVCVECGERRSTVRNWNTTMIFRVTAGIVLAFELLVLGLQWTTTGKPFGLREHSRRAVLVKLGLSHEDPTPGDTNAPLTTVTKDPAVEWCPKVAYEMWPPSSWPNGKRFRAVASSPNQAANPIGCRFKV